MATVTPTFNEITGGVQIIKWVLANGDSGAQVSLAAWPDKTVQIIGGTNVDMEGSNDGGTTWSPLTKPDGTALTDAVPGMYVISGNPAALRPASATGSVTVIVSATR